jgi:glycine betaine/proline transport system substrate-binding protein
MPIGLELRFTYLAKAALEANDFEVTITNLAPGMIFGELSKTTQRDVFLMPGLNSHKDYYRLTMVKIW